MLIAGTYSFNNGESFVRQHYPALLREIEEIIVSVDASECKTKQSKEKTMPGKALYSPRALNKAFAKQFAERDWEKKRVHCDYPVEYRLSAGASAMVRGSSVERSNVSTF